MKTVTVRSGSRKNPEEAEVIKSLGLKECEMIEDRDLETMIKERLYLKATADRYMVVNKEISKKLKALKKKEHAIVGNYYIKRTHISKEQYLVAAVDYFTVKYTRLERRRRRNASNTNVNGNRSRASVPRGVQSNREVVEA